MPHTNAAIAEKLLSLAQLLSTKGENPFKIRAYRRAAETLRNLPESVEMIVRGGGDLTQFAGIGKGIAAAVQELVSSGSMGHLETLKAEASPELVALSEYPRLDPKRVLRIYKKLGIGTVAELRDHLVRGEIAAKLGPRMEQHVRQALSDSADMLLYDADDIVPGIEAFLVKRCGAKRAVATGDFRRRVEVVSELTFLVEGDDFGAIIETFKTYGGRADVVAANAFRASFKLASGIGVVLEAAEAKKWGVALIATTGSIAHLEQLEAAGKSLESLARGTERLTTEAAVYRKLGLDFIPPELREGRDEVELAGSGGLPALVAIEDLRGDLHAHSTSSDGAHSIEAMAAAAKKRGYTYLGITDHSKSLKIAGGVSEEDLWEQIRTIDTLNEKLSGFRVLKSAEVDILPDGSLDYSDALLKELDYTVCSIHSKFGLSKEAQTTRVLRAMDSPYFNILGHATGRLLLRRAGYELDMDRIIRHAVENHCFFEINSSPDRLDLSADHARLARDAGLKIAVCTDAHSISELNFIRCGIDVARRAGLSKAQVLNTYSWPALSKLLKK